jgi:hypothetical protein
MKPRRIPILFAAALATLLAGALHAQSPSLRGRVVVRGTGEPVSGVFIRIADGVGQVVAQGRSNTAGVFSIRLPVQGTYTVLAARLGYDDFTSPPIEVGPGAAVEVQVRMASAAVTLDSLGVQVRVTPPFRDPRARTFYERVGRRGGVFLTPEKIAERRGSRTADLLRHARGMDMRGNEQIMMGVSRRTRCMPTIYINGHRRILFQPVDDYVDRSRLWAIEVYTTPEDAPPGFPPTDNYRCGVVVIWTLDA